MFTELSPPVTELYRGKDTEILENSIRLKDVIESHRDGIQRIHLPVGTGANGDQPIMADHYGTAGRPLH
jgi:hypothetical protein